MRAEPCPFSCPFGSLKGDSEDTDALLWENTAYCKWW